MINVNRNIRVAIRHHRQLGACVVLDGLGTRPFATHGSGVDRADHIVSGIICAIAHRCAFGLDSPALSSERLWARSSRLH
jgi:hypothetical protein